MDKQIVYRLRHIPSNMFYQPTKTRIIKDRSNLSENGKIYFIKNYPKFKTEGYIYISEPQSRNLNGKLKDGCYRLKYKPSDWEIVEYNLIKRDKPIPSIESILQ